MMLFYVVAPMSGPGVTGWVPHFANGTVGCMEYDANIIDAEMCNGFELAICKACKPCPVSMTEVNADLPAISSLAAQLTMKLGRIDAIQCLV